MPKGGVWGVLGGRLVVLGTLGHLGAEELGDHLRDVTHLGRLRNLVENLDPLPRLGVGSHRLNAMDLAAAARPPTGL